MAAALEFRDVAARALQIAEVLLSEWLGGRRVGREWKGEPTKNGGLGDSWTVNLDTGCWAHWGGDEKGGDLVALYAALHKINQGAAAKALEKMLGGDTPGARRLPVKKTAARGRQPAEDLPIHPPPLPPHPKFGAATHEFRYGWWALVARYAPPDGGKTFIQWSWRGGKWSPSGRPGQWPLYGEELLTQHPDAPVLLVEGETCCEAARAVLSGNVVLTWAGGAQAVDKTAWEPLRGRKVTIWPDADPPGRTAAARLAQILLPLVAELWVIEPEPDRPRGWDIGDAIAEGWDRTRLTAYARERRHPSKDRRNEEQPAPPPAGEYMPATPPEDRPDYPNEVVPRSSLVTWSEMGLKKDSKDVPVCTLSNASLIVQHHPELKGKIWFDTFAERIMHTTQGLGAREWTDQDSRRITKFIQHDLDLPKFNLTLVHEAVVDAAYERSINSVTTWLDSLHWDGIERLQTWVGDCLGVPLDEYSMAVGRNWIVSMVARAYRPGCQVDTMPVLEGTQGKGKSSAIEILGGEWFAAASKGFGTPEFIEEIQGKWLIEIPDMAGFHRREHAHVISTITTRIDRYRSKYGRFAADHPRKCVFAATSETDDYLPEMRGIRRYWPLRCGDIDLDCLRMQREQLFAEAVRVYRQGGAHHEMPIDQTLLEQQSRGPDDPWTEDVMLYAIRREYANQPVYPPKVLTDALGIEPRDMDQLAKLRVVNILVAHGWHRKAIDGKRQYVKPRREEDPSRGSGG